MSTETWILLRGLTRGAGHWGGFVDACARALPGVQVLSPDLPGNGILHRLDSPTRIETMTDELRQRLRSDGQSGRFHLLAMSMGAMLACDWASRHPEEVGGALLLNTSLRPFSPFWRRLQPANVPRLLSLAVRRAQAAEWEAAILALTSRRTEGAADTLAHWCRLHESQPVSTRNAVRQLFAAMRFRAATQAPAGVRLQILCGAGDRLVDPRCSQDLATHWQLPMSTHPWAGHDLPLDDPAWVIAELLTARQRWLGLPVPDASPSPAPVAGPGSLRPRPPIAAD